MASDESTTEEADGGIRDTLVARWKGLDGDREKIVARMEELDLIRKASQDRAGTEAGDAGGRWADGRSPEFMARRNPLAGREESKDYAFLPSLGRDRPRVHADRDARPPRAASRPPRRGRDAAVAQAPGIARHMLMYGGDEYYDAFRELTSTTRPAPACSVPPAPCPWPAAQGGYLLPYFLDTHHRADHGRDHEPVPAARQRQADHDERLPGRQLRRRPGRLPRRGRHRRDRRLPGRRADPDRRQEGRRVDLRVPGGQRGHQLRRPAPPPDPGRQGHPGRERLRRQHRRDAR